ncbi:MAG: hypothetical protein C0517_09945 [Erythrobacter sp.]|nr:hypothetical protein [Erythrobacter sp.]
MRLQLSEGWKWVDLLPSLVIPAKAGTQGRKWHCSPLENPAFAGMTEGGGFWYRAVTLGMNGAGCPADCTLMVRR